MLTQSHKVTGYFKNEVFKISEHKRGDLKISRFLKIENLTDFQYFKIKRFLKIENLTDFLKIENSQRIFSIFLLCVPVSPCEDNKTNFPVR